MWCKMHFQKKRKTLRKNFVLFVIDNLILQQKQGYSGRMTKMHGCSFNNYNSTLVHYINLCEKMIHFGRRITYIYVRIPNSNKRSFWSYTSLLKGTSNFFKNLPHNQEGFSWGRT